MARLIDIHARINVMYEEAQIILGGRRAVEDGRWEEYVRQTPGWEKHDIQLPGSSEGGGQPAQNEQVELQQAENEHVKREPAVQVQQSSEQQAGSGRPEV